MSDESIANALGITTDATSPFNPDFPQQTTAVQPWDGKDKVVAKIDIVPEGVTEEEHDFNNVRSNTYELIDNAMTAVEQLVVIASQTQDHESYASLAALIKTAAGLNRDLLTMHEKKQKVMKGDVASTPEAKVTNNTLIMTTAEMQKLLTEKE